MCSNSFSGTFQPGDYLSSPSALCTNRSMTIEAMVPGTAILDAMHGRRVLFHSAGALELRGLIITGGDAQDGAGVYVSAGSLTVAGQSVIHGNNAYGMGGGVHVEGGSFPNDAVGEVEGSVLITEQSVIRDNRAGAGGGLNVGPDSGLPRGDALVTITDESIIHDNSADTGGGGGINVGIRGRLVITGRSVVRDNSARLSSGGGIRFTSGARMSTIEEATVSGNVALTGGGLYARTPDLKLVLESATIVSNHATQPPVVTTDGVMVAGRAIATAPDGGGIFSEAGKIAVRGNTTFSGNTAAGIGANLYLPGAGLTIFFPLLPGHWLPNSECRVYREPCAAHDVACIASFDACSLVADSITSSGNTWTTQVATVQVCSDQCTTQQCTARTFIQPCNWMETASLLTDPPTKIFSPPVGIPIETPFPYECAPGVLGSADANGQVSALCAGNCPAGFYCPTKATSQALDCPPAHYCMEGSSTPRPCASGTYSNSTNLQRAADCTTADPGFYAVAGSIEQTACAKGSYTDVSMTVKDSCVACAGGAYQDAEGQTSCKPCVAGSYCPSGAAAPLPCEGGSYSDQTSLAHANGCTACPAGSACATGSTTHALCKPGSVAPEPSMATCILCEDGTFQREYGQTACEACIPGFYCKEGAAEPVPCPAGYYGNATGLHSAGQCEPVPRGFWAPLGSSLPKPCPESGFYCPGALRDAIYGGAEPIIFPVGQSTEMRETPALLKAMTLSISIDEFDAQREELKTGLATEYGVHPSLMALEVSAGSVQLTVIIAATNGTSAPINLDALELHVDAIDDAALSVAIETVVGQAVNVTSQPTERGSIEIDVRFSCRKGQWCTAGLVVNCTFGFYNPLENQQFATACLPCPPNSMTLIEAATDRSDCVCSPGWYDANASTAVDEVLFRASGTSMLAAAIDCKPCIVGFDGCPQPGTTLVTLTPRAGYWRPSLLSLDVRRCPDAGANCNISSECPESTSGCHATGSEQCRPGLKGTFCQLCSNRSMNYVPAGDDEPATCVECGDTLASTIVIAILLVSGALLVAALLFWRLGTVLSARPKMQARNALFARLRERFSLGTKCKILIGFYLIASKVDTVYEVGLPAELRIVYFQVTRVLTLGLDLALELTPLECLGLHGYFWQMIFWTIVPLGLVALVIVGSAIWLAIRRQLGCKRLLLTATPLSLQLMFLLYPTVTRKAFEAFSWYHFDDDSYLRVDVRLRPGTAEYAQARSAAIVAILIYPVGMILLNGGLLFRARQAILSKRPTELSKAIAFLHAEYEPGHLYWELIEMLRRFLLVGFFVVWPMQGTVEQLAYGTFISLIYLALQATAAPFRNPSDDFFAMVCSMLLAAFFVASIFFKYSALTDVRDVDEIMSEEQREDYQPPYGTLTLILTGTCVGAFFVLGAIIAVQAADNARAAFVEARAARARRLRYLKNDSEVVLPKLESLEARVAKAYPSGPPPSVPRSGPFHVFLSHNWQHGQSAMRLVKTRLREMLPEVEVFLDVDNLGGGSDHPHIDVSDTMLCFCTQRWFTNDPCLREFIRAILRKTPMIALLEPFTGDVHGGHTEDEARDIIASPEWWERWQGFEARGEVQTWAEEWGQPDLRLPTAQEAIDALFASTPIVWSRLADFQDVTMRFIGERLIEGFSHPYGAAYAQITYVQDELATRVKACQMKLPLTHGRRYHLFCSANNPGTLELAKELHALCPAVTFTSDMAELDACEHFVVHLHSKTWTRGDDAEEGSPSHAFTKDVAAAMRLGVHCMLIHEVPGAASGDQEARRACPFEHFFSDEATPKCLLKAGLYNEIAMNAAGGEHREAGHLKTIQDLAKGGTARKPVEVVMDLPAVSGSSAFIRPAKLLPARAKTDVANKPATAKTEAAMSKLHAHHVEREEMLAERDISLTLAELRDNPRDAEREAAAVKVQAAMRGHQARKDMRRTTQLGTREARVARLEEIRKQRLSKQAALSA